MLVSALLMLQKLLIRSRSSSVFENAEISLLSSDNWLSDDKSLLVLLDAFLSRGVGDKTVNTFYKIIQCLLLDCERHRFLYDY